MELNTPSHDHQVPTMTPEDDFEIPQPRPMNVERIVEEAQNFEFNPLIPLKYWLRTASTLLKEAKIYQHERNDQQLYLLLFRHATLVLRHLSIHPEARQPNHRLALLRANKDVQSSLAKLEVLKPRLNKRYETYEQNLKDSDSRVDPTFTTADNDLSLQIAPDNRPWLPWSTPVISSSSENSTSKDDYDIAITLAQNEIRRRALTTVNTLHPIFSRQDGQGNRAADGLGDKEDMSRCDEQGLHQTSRKLQPTRNSFRIQSDDTEQSNLETFYLTDEIKTSTYRYPDVYRQGATESRVLGDQAGSPKDEWPLKSSSVTQPPERPPKAQAKFASGGRTSRKLTHETVWDLEDTVDVTPSTPSPQHKSPAFTFKYSASLENGAFLRTVFLPPSLRISFLSLALPNTRANLETCGILCGTLISNALFISKLVIPDQESTSDTCETINEDKLFDYVDGEDLMVLGWIHTHPTQTCFMSSRDLHTHAGYQAMMPESIAIVCAPSKGDWGVFRLTDPPGLSSILKCTQTGLFHPHSDSNIYTDALRPGHVYEAKGLDFETVDLRMKC